MVGSARIGVILDGSSTYPAPAPTMYLSGLKEAIAEDSDLHIVRIINSPPILAEAENKVKQLLEDKNLVDAICCSTPRNTLGAARGIRGWGGKRRIVFIGTGLLPDILQLLHADILQATVDSYPYAMGSGSVRLIADIMAGRPHQEQIITGVQVFRLDDGKITIPQFNTGEAREDG